jgi:hypothetical protein
MSASEIAKLLDEAAAARQLAAIVEDSAAVDDLLDYAFALEACAAGERSVPPAQPDWLSQRARNHKADH